MTMSKLAKMQEAKLEKLRLLSSAGRNQLEEALRNRNHLQTSPPALNQILFRPQQCCSHPRSVGRPLPNLLFALNE
jgi:hypothetical protein